MPQYVCGNDKMVVTNSGTMNVVEPPAPVVLTYLWDISVLTNMLKEDDSPVTTIGDVIFRLKSNKPENAAASFYPWYPGVVDNFRTVGFTYGMWNGHHNMTNLGLTSNGVFASYTADVLGYGTFFVAYRITGTPVSYQPMFSLGGFCMQIMPGDTTKVGSNQDWAHRFRTVNLLDCAQS